MDDLCVIEIRASKYLPETVKDKDGRDPRLLGVMTPKDFFSSFDLFSYDSPSSDEIKRIVFIVEDNKESA